MARHFFRLLPTSMAGKPENMQCSDNEIQSMVRGIFAQLCQEGQSAQSVRHETVNSEINQAFRLPRNINTSNTVEEEPGSSQPVSLPQAQQPLTLPVPSFNPHCNYSNALMGRRCGPIRPGRSGHRRRANLQGNLNVCSSTSTQACSSDRNEFFLKDVYLLPRPTYDRVPRRQAKENLQKEGYCIDAFTFDKRWNEQMIREKVAMLFPNVLKDEKSFEFVKSSGTSIVPVNLPSGQKMTGKVLKHVAGNGPVYIRSCIDVEFQISEEDSLASEDETLPEISGISTSSSVASSYTFQPSTPGTQRCLLGQGLVEPRLLVEPNKTVLSCDIRSYMSQTSSSSSFGKPACLPIQGSATTSSEESIVRSGSTNNSVGETESQLQHVNEMFPFLDQKTISKALFDANMNVEVAIDKLLQTTEPGVHDELGAHNEPEDIRDDDEIWDAPIATAMFSAGNPLQALKRFADCALNTFGEEVDLVINRNKDILQQVVRKYKHPEFDVTKSLNVSFVNEPGVDAGGLTREYFHILMNRLPKPLGYLDLFEGRKGHLLPMHNYDLISGGVFVIVGKMVLHSILNNCTGLPGLSPGVIAYIASGSRDAAVEHLTLEDIPDPILQDKLDQLLNSKKDKLPEFTSPDSSVDISETLMAAGFPHISITNDRRYLAYECCLTYEVLTKRLASLDDIRKGLSSVRVAGHTLADLLAKWPELKQRVFPVPEIDLIDAATLRSRLFYKRDDSANEKSREFFEKYIDELSARQGDPKLETLKDLVLFWTGFATLPVDDSALTVAFLQADPSKALPQANTCPMVLSIPTIHEDYNDFRVSMDSSIANGKYGFGKI